MGSCKIGDSVGLMGDWDGGIHTAKLTYLNSVRLSLAHRMMMSSRAVSSCMSITCCAAMLRFCHGVVVMYCAMRSSLRKASFLDSRGFWWYAGAGGWASLVMWDCDGGFAIEEVRGEARGLYVIVTGVV